MRDRYVCAWCLQTVAEMVGEHRMGKFRGEFEKLFQALQRVQDSERRLVHKSRQLNDEVDAKVASVNAVLAMTQQEAIANVQTHRVNGCRNYSLYDSSTNRNS